MKIVLTSTKEKNIDIANRFRNFHFLSFPCIEYAIPSDCYQALDQAIRSNHLYEWVFFFSAKAAEVFFERLIAIGGNFFNLSNHLKFAVIGKTTHDFLINEVNMPVDFMPSVANSDAFTEEFLAKYQYDFNCAFKILLPRSELARDDFKERIESSKNYQLDIVPAYNTVKAVHSSKELDDFLKEHVDVIGFSSPSCVDNFFEYFVDYDFSSVKVLSIGAKTSACLGKHGLKNFIEAPEANFDSLLNLL